MVILKIFAFLASFSFAAVVELTETNTPKDALTNFDFRVISFYD